MLSKIAIFAAANLAGFTLNIATMQPINKGYAVAVEQTQDSFNKDGLKKCLKYACKNNTHIGGWYDKQSGRYYYDAVQVFEDLQQALNAGQINNQIAIFDLNTNTEIRLK